MFSQRTVNNSLREQKLDQYVYQTGFLLIINRVKFQAICTYPVNGTNLSSWVGQLSLAFLPTAQYRTN